MDNSKDTLRAEETPRKSLFSQNSINRSKDIEIKRLQAQILNMSKKPASTSSAIVIPTFTTTANVSAPATSSNHAKSNNSLRLKTNNNNSNNANKSSLNCSTCGKSGHLTEKCFRTHACKHCGKLPGHSTKMCPVKNSRNVNANIATLPTTFQNEFDENEFEEFGYMMRIDESDIDIAITSSTNDDTIITESTTDIVLTKSNDNILSEQDIYRDYIAADTGCTSTCTSYPEFISIDPTASQVTIKCANGTIESSLAVGFTGEHIKTTILVKNLPIDLLAISPFDNLGYSITQQNKVNTISKDGIVISKGYLHNGLYLHRKKDFLSTWNDTNETEYGLISGTKINDPIMLYHLRANHIKYDKMYRQLKNRMVYNIYGFQFK